MKRLILGLALLCAVSPAFAANTVATSVPKQDGNYMPAGATTLTYVDGSGVVHVVGAGDGLPINSTSTDGSTTQTTGGTAQALFSGATPTNGFKVALPSASQSSTPCWISDTTTTPSATTAGSYPVFLQGQYSSEVGEKPVGPVYINCPTTGQVISAKKW